MSDNLISRLTEASKIWISRSSVGKKELSINFAVEIDGDIQSLVIGRPFLGIDERMWGILRESKMVIFPNTICFEMKLCRVSVAISKLFIDYTSPNEFLSIEEITFTRKDGSTLKIFGDIDSFEVPCINSELLEP